MSRARKPPPGGDAGLDAPIAPLLPPDRPRPRPAVLGVAALAPDQPATSDDGMPLLDVARLDDSGRFTSRPLLRTLGWAAGQRIGLQVHADAVVLTAEAAGPLTVGSRGDLPLDPETRSLRCGEADIHEPLFELGDQLTAIVSR